MGSGSLKNIVTFKQFKGLILDIISVSNTWNHLNVCKQMNFKSFRIVANKSHIYCWTLVIKWLSSQTIQCSIKTFEQKLPQWSNKCSEFEHTSRAIKNGTRANEGRGKPNTVERLAESTRAVSVSISPRWSTIERVSDIVFVKILRFVCVYSLRYGYFVMGPKKSNSNTTGKRKRKVVKEKRCIKMIND